MRPIAASVGACLLLGIAACAGPSTQIPGSTAEEVASEKSRQRVHLIRTHLFEAARLIAVAHRMTVANRGDCKQDVAPKLGFAALTPNDLPAQDRDLATSELRLDAEKPTVTAVVEQGPVAKAGILPGDVIVALDGEEVPSEAPLAWIAAHVRESGGAPIQVAYRRQGKNGAAAVQPVMGCAVPIVLARAGEVNAFTDGRRIVVNSGVLRLAQTDAQLATIIGHELAHVTMRHIEKQTQNQVVGAAGGLVVDIAFAAAGVNTGGAFSRGLGSAGARAFATDFEREADYVGTYYVARAGYDIAGAEQFWSKLAQESPRSIAYAGLHPTTPERFLQMRKTIDEIATKRRTNRPLNPEVKPAATAQVATEVVASH
jgi:hypothetical protein